MAATKLALGKGGLPVKLPKTTDDLTRWARDRVSECFVSVEKRRDLNRSYTNIFYSGAADGSEAKHNKVFNHVDKLSSYLFSPAEVRFVVDFDGSDQPLWRRKAEVAARHINRLFSRKAVDTSVSEAVLWSLVKGVTLMRLNWGHSGFEPWVIQPDFFGVMNEAESTLERQECFAVTTLMTEPALERLLTDNPRRREIMNRIGGAYDASSLAELQNSAPNFTVFGGGTWPNGGIGVPGVSVPPVSQTGLAGVLSAQSGPMLSPEVQSRLIEFHEIWAWDDDRDDWTTVQFAEPGLIFEGRYQRRNLTGVRGEQPFVKFCSNEVPNYFWGRSEIANIAYLQRLLNARIDNIDEMYRKAANPARSFRGFSGLTTEKAKALQTAGAVLTDGAPASTTAIDTHRPEIPQGYIEYIARIEGWFDEAGGFTAILSGQGEPGVRAGTHANTLLRTSTPRLRDRALLVEKQVAQIGDLAFHLTAAKDATVFTVPSTTPVKGGVLGSIMKLVGGTEEQEEFTLSQLPKDASVLVDSHTSSPAFSGEAEQKAFALHQRGAVGPEDLIRLTHPPMEDELIENLRLRQAGQERQMEELKQVDPEAWAKAMSQRGRGH